MNHSPSQNALYTGYLRLKAVRPTTTDDWFLIEEHKAILVRHLEAALAEIGSTVTDFVSVDADQYLVDVRHQFNPRWEASPIQDAFSDAFKRHQSALKDLGGEPVMNRKAMPSGVLK